MRIYKYIVIFIYSLLFCQEIPNDFKSLNIRELRVDAGKDWNFNTTLGSPRFQDKIDFFEKKTKNKDSLYVKTRFGFLKLNKDIAIYGFGHFTYQNNLYGYLYPRIVNNSNSFIGYSGIPREISRGGFNSGETDLSGIGFENNWLTFQFGRGRESWGAGQGIRLALCEKSASYDYGMLASNYGNLRVKYIHGFLESTDENINRYISGRGIEWANNKSLIIGISEIVIYSGFDRSFDFGYLNPISSHLEIELNERLNEKGSRNANAVWQISVDHLFRKKIRFSGNFLIDELVLDRSQLESGKEQGNAFSSRIAYNPFNIENKFFTLFASYIRVGTPTFRHINGNNNFVQRGEPLGIVHGSDFQEFQTGFNFFNRENFILNFKISYLEKGEEAITQRPYDQYLNYQKDEFPSGEDLIKGFKYETNIKYWYKENIEAIVIFEKNNLKIDKSQFSTIFGLNFYIPNSFEL